MRARLDAALASISNNVEHPHQLDDAGRCAIQVPLPAGLVDGLDVVDVTVRLSGSNMAGATVSLIAPLASLTEDQLSAEFATSLLRRQFFAIQTDGASFAISDREDVLVAIYHWLPEEITSEEFAHVFGRFVGAAVLLHGEAVTAAAQGAPILPLMSN